MSFLSPNTDDTGLLQTKRNNILERDVGKERLIWVFALILFILVLPRGLMGDFWNDETASMWIAKLDFIGIVNNCDVADMHPPLYYLVLSAFYNVFGSADFVYHFVSLLCFGGMLLICATAVYRQFGWIASAVTMMLVTFIASGYVFQNEVRMYEMAILFTFAAYVAFYYILQYDRKIDWILFVAFSLLASYTYYYCLLMVGSLYLVLLIRGINRRKEERNGIRNILVATIVSVVAYLPIVGLLIRTVKGGTDGFWIPEVMSPLDAAMYMFDGFGLLFFAFVALAIYALWKNHQDNPNKGNGWRSIRTCSDDSVWIVGGLLAITLTIVVVLIVSIIWNPIGQPRHLYPMSVFAWLLFAVCLSRLDIESLKRYVPVFFVAALVVGGASYAVWLNTDVQKWESTKNILSMTSEIDGDDVIFTDIGHFGSGEGSVMSHYYPEATVKMMDGHTVPTLEDGKHYWLYLDDEITDDIKQQLKEQGYEAKFVINDSFARKYQPYIYSVSKI